MKCAVCEDKVKKNDVYYGDKATAYEGQPVCGICYYESEPAATVFYNRDEQPYIISSTRNETDGDFRVKWRSTDPWRGYYVAESDKYSMVNTAELLAFHKSQDMIAHFDFNVRYLFEESEIDYARVFARSSNVFFQNYDLFVCRDQVIHGSLLVAKARNDVDYDNPEWYRNILFDEKLLNTISGLFPERKIETDHDVLKLVDDDFDELMERLRQTQGVKG